MFAVFSGTEERPWGVIFKPEPDERPALLQDRRFYVPATSVPTAGSRSTSAPASASTGARSPSSWRARTAKLALKRMLKALEERGERQGKAAGGWIAA